MDAFRACRNGERKEIKGEEVADTARQYVASDGNRGGIVVMRLRLSLRSLIVVDLGNEFLLLLVAGFAWDGG